MSHACRKLVAYGKSTLRVQISINRAKIVRKGLGTEHSQKFREFQEQNASHPQTACSMNELTIRV